MTSSNQESQNMRLKNIISSYCVYVALFIGTGFLSGSIVHYPMAPYRYLIIGILGAIIFTTASTINEALFNKRNFKDEGVVNIVFFSLLLSLGIGMISGGVQHFDEFPIYGSYLIPIGIVLSLVAFIFKSNIKLLGQQAMKLGLATLLLVVPLGLGLNSYARTMDVSSHGHSDSNTNSMMKSCGENGCKGMENHEDGHSMNVQTDADFLMGMIPHHQEAVDTSAYLLTRTTDPDLQTFVKAVIDVQSTEINQMREWHKNWFNSDYQADGNYMLMMGDLTKLSGKELEVDYIKGMIAHHKGAIDMAQQISAKTKRPELLKMAQDIINTQSNEVALLESWLETKYEGSFKTTTKQNNSMMDDDHDGMMHH